MRFTVDEGAGRLRVGDDGPGLDLYSPEAFSILSRCWLKVGWDLKYTYGFTWMGRPLIQLPEDVLRIQEVIYRVRPDVIIETGVAHGGSLVFYASLCRAMGKGRVLGIDIEIRPHNRRAIQTHEMSPLITLLEGDSTNPTVIREAHDHVRPGENVIVILDSNHTKSHVLAELEGYGPLVTPGSYIVAADGVMELLHDVPRGKAEWRSDNPKAAAVEFAARHPEFVLEEPPVPFNEGQVQERITYWPGSHLRRRE